MGAVDDPAIVFGIDVGLRTKLKAEVLDDIVWGACELVGNVAQVDDDSLDTVAFALDLGLHTLHLVAVEGIRDIPANVDVGHGCGIVGVLVRRGWTGEAEEGCGSNWLSWWRFSETYSTQLADCYCCVC